MRGSESHIKTENAVLSRNPFTNSYKTPPFPLSSSSKLIRQRPMTRIPDQERILGQRPPRNHLPRRPPSRQPRRQLLLPDIHAQLVRLRANRHEIAIPHDGNRPADRRLGNHVPNDEAMTRAAVAPIRDERHVGQLGAHERRAGLELFRHSRTPLGTLVAHDQDEVLAALDLAPVQRVVERVLLVEDARPADELGALFARDLGDGAARSEISPQDLQVAGRLDGVR